MSRNWWHAIAAFFAIALICPNFHSQEGAKQWLRRVADTYRGFLSYHFEGTIISEIDSFGKTSTSSSFARYGKPKENKFRYQAGLGESRCVLACDGISTIIYSAGNRRYVEKKSVDMDAVVRSVFGDRSGSCLGAALPWSYETLDAKCSSARILKDETNNLPSGRVEAVVVEAELSPERDFPKTRIVRTLWIDKEQCIVLRDVLHSQTISTKGKVFSDLIEEMRLISYQVNQELENSIFKFEPPRMTYRAESFPDSENGLSGGPPPIPIEDGYRIAKVNITGMLYLDGRMKYTYRGTAVFSAPQEEFQQNIHRGFATRFEIPVAEPGFYELQASVSQRRNMRLGNVSVLVEVPDYKHCGLSASGIATYNVSIDAVSYSAPPPVTRKILRSNPFSCSLYVYNAERSQADGKPQIESQLRLYRDDKLVKASEVISVSDQVAAGTSGGIPVDFNIDPSPDLTAGNYRLEVLIIDQLAKKNSTIAQSVAIELVD